MIQQLSVKSYPMIDRNSRNTLILLSKAYRTEFAGNIKGLSLEAAKAWAKDYPEIWGEYLDVGNNGGLQKRKK